MKCNANHQGQNNDIYITIKSVRWYATVGAFIAIHL
jgi:hypothetical protein